MCAKRPTLGEERIQAQYFKEYHVYMIIWKLLVGQCLQYVKESTNEVDKNAVAVVCTNSHCKKRWLAMCNRSFHDCIHVSIPDSLRSERTYYKTVFLRGLVSERIEQTCFEHLTSFY